MRPLSESKTRPGANSWPRFSFEAIGTSWSIEVYQPVSKSLLNRLKRLVTVRIETFDRHYSRFRPDSLVAEIARQAGAYRLPEDARPLIDLYLELYKLSQGEVTPLIGGTLEDAGYDAEYSLTPGELRSPPAWEAVLDYDFPHLTVAAPAVLDFGAAGKGYLIDIIAAIIQDLGISAFCIDAGGDLLYCHPTGEAMEVGLEHPDDPSKVIGVAEIATGSLCGSAGNRRRWAGYHHIIRPSTLTSPDHIKAVWVAAGTALIADAMTTGLYFMAPSVLQERYTFEYAVMYRNNTVETSAQFPANFFTSEN